MRLLHLDAGRFTLTKDLVGDDSIPPYAILSHTWGPDSEEVTFEDMTNGTGKQKFGYDKIRFCGEQAEQNGLQYFWVDTCCINKQDNAELSRSINSMYRWYRNAARCYVYLPDISTRKKKRDRDSRDTWESDFRRSRWFTRGWTLQELLAPASVEFFSRERERLGDKSSLMQLVIEITNISPSALRGDPFSQFSVAERLQWIEHRETKLEEDRAYSLLGIFGVYILPVYGEGKAKALDRLLDEFRNMQKCIQDLRLTDPNDDKKRIEDTKGGLLEDSCRWIPDNSDFRQWRDGQQNRLLWIKGDPGKGKTMLLCSIINELKSSIAKSDLLSFFFCQATDSRINNATAVLRGLIYLLVKQQPSLILHARKKYEQAGKTIFEDANAWVALAEIFTDILQDPTLNSTYLIVDALDECTADLPRLLDLIVRMSSISARVKWIVSSRNWPSIEKNLDTAAQKLTLCLELNEESVSTAVTAFIKCKVDWLATRNKYSCDTRAGVRQYLSLNAHGTFLWVALVCQELSDTPGWKTQQKLTTFPPGLDALYGRMMEQIEDSEDVELCKRILAAVSTVYRPLTLNELESLVEAMPDGVTREYEVLSEMIGLCGSYLTVRERTISFVHQSAKDFFVGKAYNKIYPRGMEDVHHTIFSRSLQVMSETLRRDIYGLGSLGISIDEVKQPDPDPLDAAKYSCVYWIDHLLDCDPARNATKDLQDGGSVNIFLRRSYLYWLEALCLCRSISEGVVSMAKLEALSQARVDGSGLLNLVQDARRFIMSHKLAIERSPLQIYASALLFSPTSSMIRSLFRHEEPKWITILPNMREDWSACLATLEGHGNGVMSVAFSPDSTRLVSASRDKTVKIWDARSGTCLYTLEGHSNCVTSVAFSPDSARLASASRDKTVKVWNARTGACLYTLEGHRNCVTSVAFSPDSAQLVSASRDKTVKIWNVRTGACLHTLEGHSVYVTSVAFSSDSARLASASRDKTVKIWNTRTGACLHTLEGHSNCVTSVAFSPDSAQLASASRDKTVKFWDARTSACLHTLEGHGNYVTSVVFSPDSAWLASASRDKTVKMWDARTGACLTTLGGHHDWVTSVAFSPNSAQLVSASRDKTVKIWDAYSGTYLATLEGHHNCVTSVAFSPDLARLVSASRDKTVKVWDARTGACLCTLEGHRNWVTLVAFSPDSAQFASTSRDKTVKIWNVRTGACLHTLEGHSDWVTSVAFSPNSAQLVSASRDKTVKMWDACTGACLQTLDVGKTLSAISFDVSSSHFQTEVGTIAINASSASFTSSLVTNSQLPQNEGGGLSSDGTWVTYNSEKILWIPSEYRPSCSSVSATTIGIGVGSGNVWMCDIDRYSDQESGCI